MREGACTAVDVHALVARVVDAEREDRAQLSGQVLESLRVEGARGDTAAKGVVERYFAYVAKVTEVRGLVPVLQTAQ